MEAVPPSNIANIQARQCGLNCRLRYRKCLVDTNYRGAEMHTCAQHFVREYPVCFFKTPTTHHQKNNEYTCTAQCVVYFDQCLFFSSKPESMVCLRARKHCASQCMYSVRGTLRVKREDCYGVCAGYFVICEQVVEQYEDLYICKVNEQACKKTCDRDQE